MHPRLKYSHAVRIKVIEAAMLMLTKAGCEVTVTTDRTDTVLVVHNPLDPADRIGEMAKSVLAQQDSHTETHCGTSE